jgi:uncharacterized protein YoxC
MTTMDIFSIILMAAASGLCIALIFFFAKLTKTVSNVDSELKNITAQLAPITNQVTILTEQVNVMVEEIKTPLNASINVFLQLKERVDLVLSAEEDIREYLMTNISAVVNGIKAFTNVYSSNGHPKEKMIFRS